MDLPLRKVVNKAYKGRGTETKKVVNKDNRFLKHEKGDKEKTQEKR